MATLAKHRNELVDARFAVRAVRDHIQLFGEARRAYAYDRAGHSQENVEELKALGVKQVALAPSWLLSGTAPILLKGPPPLDTLPRCSVLSWGWWCGSSVRAHRLLQRTSFSDSNWRLRRVGCSASA